MDHILQILIWFSLDFVRKNSSILCNLNLSSITISVINFGFILWVTLIIPDKFDQAILIEYV